MLRNSQSPEISRISSSKESARSSIELPLSHIIIEYFNQIDFREKIRILQDFSCKVLCNQAFDNTLVDEILEEYFSSSIDFKNLDQKFLKEMLLNGYNPSQKLIEIFKTKNFIFDQVINPANNIFYNIDIELYRKNNYDRIIIDSSQTKLLIDSINDAVKFLLKDSSRDYEKNELIFIQFNGNFIPFKPIGLINFLCDNKFCISPTETSNAVLFSKYKGSKELNESLKVIQCIINKDKNHSELAIASVRSSLEDYKSDAINPSIEYHSSSSQNPRYKIVSNSQTSCCYGLLNFFKKIFKKEKSEEAPKPKTRVISQQRSSDSRGVLMD